MAGFVPPIVDESYGTGCAREVRESERERETPRESVQRIKRRGEDMRGEGGKTGLITLLSTSISVCVCVCVCARARAKGGMGSGKG